MTIAVRRSGFTIPLSLVVLTSTAMLLAGCQSGGASNANQQGTTGSSSSAKAQSTASAKATSGQKSGHASPRIPSPTGKGPADSSASQPSGSQSRPASPRANEPRPAASGTDATRALASGKTDAPGQQNSGASKAPQAQGKTDDAGKSYAGSTQAPSSPAPETQKRAEQQAPAEKPADKPAEKPAEAPADKPADAQPAPADKPAEAPADKPAENPAEPTAPADEQPSQATSFVPGNLVSEKTAMIVSPSGNIGCDLSAHYAGCGVLSYRSNGTYGKDEAGSPKWWFDLSSGGTPQLAGRSEGAFSLDEAFRGGGSSPQVVEYGQSVTFGSWVCSSEETGMTCRNTETGHGVFLSSGRYETF
ncbi:hypothetical protein HMPREF0059_01030 [Actinomyces viscosus C505]|uniref:Ig-like domain-containing protein n=1 Tax=Actinomyces viscosus C505 TaxID=562973 RepID=F2UY75_ACTVI|nr:hypothetical protein [Actinomyces viscosus]EGE38176.1 hypothetical protein HMPREF0059_01030 [Actinomyces viscosus C505]